MNIIRHTKHNEPLLRMIGSVFSLPQAFPLCYYKLLHTDLLVVIDSSTFLTIKSHLHRSKMDLKELFITVIIAHH